MIWAIYHLTNQTIKKRMALTNVKDIRDKEKKRVWVCEIFIGWSLNAITCLSQLFFLDNDPNILGTNFSFLSFLCIYVSK